MISHPSRSSSFPTEKLFTFNLLPQKQMNILLQGKENSYRNLRVYNPSSFIDRLVNFLSVRYFASTVSSLAVNVNLAKKLWGLFFGEGMGTFNSLPFFNTFGPLVKRIPFLFSDLRRLLFLPTSIRNA